MKSFTMDHVRWHMLKWKLSPVKRHEQTTVSAGGYRLVLPDAASFLSAYREIFVNKIYSFPFPGGRPQILDLGANIGLSVLFFKRLFPHSTITAFEPDPVIFRFLKENIRSNGVSGVELVNKAAWTEDGALAFTADGADGGRVTAEGGGSTIAVEGIDLAAYLGHRRFDFIKMDIEGAEEVVLPACEAQLRSVKYLFLEYHSRNGKRQQLAQLLAVLARAGFRVHLHNMNVSPRPFMELVDHGGHDLLVNLFAWRSSDRHRAPLPGAVPAGRC
jgi:FkbM family methyltransferase